MRICAGYLKKDRRGDGTIDADAFEKSLRFVGVTSLRRRDFEALARHYDVDGTGAVDYSEFVKTVRQRRRKGRSSYGDYNDGRSDIDAYDDDMYDQYDGSDYETSEFSDEEGLGGRSRRSRRGRRRGRNARKQYYTDDDRRSGSLSRRTRIPGVDTIKLGQWYRELKSQAPGLASLLRDAFRLEIEDDVECRDLEDGLCTERVFRSVIHDMGLQLFSQHVLRKLIRGLTERDRGAGKRGRHRQRLINYDHFLRAVSDDVDGGAVAAKEKLRKVLIAAKEQGLDLLQTFKSFDSNNDGHVNALELKGAAEQLGCHLNAREAPNCGTL